MQAGEGWRRRRRWSIRRKTSVDQTFSLRTVQFYQEQRPIESESESELGSISSPAHTSSNSQQSLNQWERESVSIAELQLQYSTSIVLQHRHIERRGHGHGRRHTSTRVSRENEVKKATDETEKSSCYWSPDFYLPFVILANRLVPGCLNNKKTTINNRATVDLSRDSSLVDDCYQSQRKSHWQKIENQIEKKTTTTISKQN